MSKRDRRIIYETLRNWIKEYHLTWMRWEMAGQGDLNYINHYHEIMAALTQEFPDLNIECCLGGGTRFDLGMIRYCTSTWLSDHTADADVCRFHQTGALHFWPSHLLNSRRARSPEDAATREATAYNLISRMPGTLSFNGDIAQWCPEATRRMRALVDAYKSVRHLQSQPVFYPLPQPRNPRKLGRRLFRRRQGRGATALCLPHGRAGANSSSKCPTPRANGRW